MTLGLEGRTIAYDASNRPWQVTYRGATTSFKYGPDGARLKKITAQGTTLYLGDTEITPPGSGPAGVSQAIVHPHPDVRLVDGWASYLHRDHLASVTVMTDHLGVVVSWRSYRPYGDGEGLDWTAASTTPESKGFPGA